MTLVKHPKQLQFGEAEIAVINVGHLNFPLAASLGIPEDDWLPRHRPFFEQPLELPVQCIYIKLPHTSMLVDACFYDFPPGFHFAIPGYQPPPGLVEQLATIDVSPESIEHVIITHTHFDHYNGTTVKRNGRFEPAYPNARYYVGQADWHGFIDPNDPVIKRTLAVIYDRGIVTLTNGGEITAGVSLIPTPGETPGHQIVRLQSAGQTLYCLGDLYHHQVEVEQPTWAVTWGDAEAAFASRQKFTEAALAEDATLIATHIAGLGRLQHAENGVQWETVPE